MIKIIKNTFLLMLSLVLITACDEENGRKIFNEPAILHFTSNSAILGAKTSANTYSIEVATTSADAATIQLSVASTSTAIEGVHFEALPSTVSIGQGEFVTTFTIVPLPDNMDVGETVNIVIDIANPAEKSQGQELSFDLTVTRICPPYPGDWIVTMYDTWGDGWQTDTNATSTSRGLEVTLDDDIVLSTILESGFEGTGTITIPEGTDNATWYFPGDFYGEISFEITGPDGSLVYTSPLGAGAGILPIVLCAP